MSLLAVAHTEISERQHDTTGPLIAFSGSCNEITPVWVGLVKGKTANLKRYLPNLSTHFPEVKEWIQRCGLVGKCAKYTVWDVTLGWHIVERCLPGWRCHSVTHDKQFQTIKKVNTFIITCHTLSLYAQFALDKLLYSDDRPHLNLYPHWSIYIKHASFMPRHVS